MPSLDPRFHPIRKDLAAASLRDQIKALRYAEGVPRQVSQDVLALRRAPREDAALDTELLFGEYVTAYDEKSGWSWVQNSADHYVGYVRTKGLTDALLTPSHRIQAVATFVYPQPDLKTPPLRRLSMGARVTVVETLAGFCRDARGGWIFAHHTTDIANIADDHAKIALQFQETPYLWGGKTSLGLDCSGLVQIALDRCGVTAPRDTDVQARDLGNSLDGNSLGGVSLGSTISNGDISGLARGDLVFWPGHVGIYIDSKTFVHANATDMKVSTAPLQSVAAAIKASTGDPISDIRRL